VEGKEGKAGRKYDSFAVVLRRSRWSRGRRWAREAVVREAVKTEDTLHHSHSHIHMSVVKRHDRGSPALLALRPGRRTGPGENSPGRGAVCPMSNRTLHPNSRMRILGSTGNTF